VRTTCNPRIPAAWCDTKTGRCYTSGVPTTRPRYTFTDTGELQEMLDLAQRAWPEIEDRKELLYRLARTGEDALRAQVADEALATRRDRQRAALERAGALIDVDAVLADAAWR
jgi:hypothetical protein